MVAETDAYISIRNIPGLQTTDIQVNVQHGEHEGTEPFLQLNQQLNEYTSQVNLTS